MAYLNEIPKLKCRCGKPATVQLFNRFNAPCGEFCSRCGRRILAEFNRREAAHLDKNTWREEPEKGTK